MFMIHQWWVCARACVPELKVGVHIEYISVKFLVTICAQLSHIYIYILITRFFFFLSTVISASEVFYK